MRRYWPRSLAWQMIALLLLALLAAQALSVVILADERRVALETLKREQLVDRIEALVEVLERTPESVHPRLLRHSGSPQLRFEVRAQSAVQDNDDDGGWVRQRLEESLGEQARRVRVALEGEVDSSVFAKAGRGWRHRGPPGVGAGSPLPVAAIAIELPNGRWLNAYPALPPVSLPPTQPSLISLLAVAAAIVLIVIFMVRRVSRPLRELAHAAERLGRGEPGPLLPEKGPEEVRRTTQAFNRMQERLGRFVQDRTRMLAAISHDLRTPITSMRLRAEFIDDAETKEKILAMLEEMQRMVEATLAFAREDAAGEATRAVDLAALIASVTDDLADLGEDTSFEADSKLVYACRPLSLKRAIRNLVQNALKYGKCARVRLRRAAIEVLIEVEDDGPGIPEAEQARVFEPFVRLETSRSLETGGIGLGLAIARTIVRGHGGDIRLTNRDEGGLVATIALPAGSS